jgi:hypothetical protein
MELAIVILLSFILVFVLVFGFFITKAVLVIAEEQQIMTKAILTNVTHAKRGADTLEKIARISGNY